MRIKNVLACLLALSFTLPLHADDPARFDLVGPKLDIRITRAGKTLPIAEVPNLEPGDKIWIKADLPPTQSNHLLLIVAFLRGTTNEPPDNWFTEIDTWDKKEAEGTTITVPNEAEQAVIFIAPQTGGDFKTLRSAVKGKPGLFIRAVADLNEASFEQQRIQRYLAGMKALPPGGDPKKIQQLSAKLADTLALKPDDKCLTLPADQQVNCLTVTSAPVLLNDGHGMGVAEALTSDASANAINATAATPLAGAAVYSAYVGAIVDVVHLVALLKTAQYQYIPGLGFPTGQTVNLKLNTPPAFHKPQTVIVVALPEIQKAKLPPLRPHDPNQVSCLLQPRLTLAVDGAPLVFATSFAHDMVLHLNRNGAPADIALEANASEGGLVIAKEDPHHPVGDSKTLHSVPAPTGNDATVTGTIRGFWGFDTFEGPTVTLQQVDGKNWSIVGTPQLVAGQDNKLTIKADANACVEKIALTNTKDHDLDVAFKPAAGNDAKTSLALDVSLKTVQPGGYSLAIKQFGKSDVDKVPLTAYTGNIHFDALKLHAGDSNITLTGQGVKDVVSIDLAGQTFTPTKADDDKTLHLQAKTGVSPNNGTDAAIKLKDGRSIPIKVTVDAARPGLKLLSFKATPARQDGTLPIILDAKNDILLNGTLNFVVQTANPFPRDQTVEVATADNSVHTTLSLAKNNLVLQDDHTAVATLNPLAAFGQSAFGKLAMRPVAADGTAGDWTALGLLVRAPTITTVTCTTTCSVEGKNLFLIQAFSATKDFAKPTEVPTGFAEPTFQAPTPADGTTLYLKLRDDPASIATITLPKPAPKPAAAASPTTPPPPQ